MDFRDVNKNIFISCYDFKECADMNKLARYENYAQREIERLKDTIESIEQYRRELCEHAQRIASMPYRRRLSIKRYKGNSVTFTIEILRIYENDLTARELLEVYTGKDRAKALSRFEQLKKENNGIESVKDIAKGSWER